MSKSSYHGIKGGMNKLHQLPEKQSLESTSRVWEINCPQSEGEKFGQQN